MSVRTSLLAPQQISLDNPPDPPNRDKLWNNFDKQTFFSYWNQRLLQNYQRNLKNKPSSATEIKDSYKTTKETWKTATHQQKTNKEQTEILQRCNFCDFPLKSRKLHDLCDLVLPLTALHNTPKKISDTQTCFRVMLPFD